MKDKIKSSISPQDLTVLSFNSSEFNGLQWKEPGEFFHNGNMYDVVREVQGQDGSVVIYCINDTREKEILSAIEGQSRKNSDNPLNGKNGINLLAFFFGLHLPVNQVFINMFYLSCRLPSNYHFVLNCCILDIPSPPPKLV